MAYSRNPVWEDLPSTNTPIYASSLNHIEDGLVDAAAKADAPDWGSIQNKPDTFPPTIGVTGTTAKAGNWNPAVTDINATGTRSSGTFLRGDGVWAVPAGGGGGGATDSDVAAALGFGPLSQAVGDARWVLKGEAPLSAEDYAVGDGTTDDTTNLQNFFTTGAGKSMIFPRGRTYRVTGNLNIGSGVIDLNGSTLDARTMSAATALSQRIVLNATGSLGTAIVVSTPIALNSRTIAGIASTAGLAAEDLILISNDEQPVPGMTRVDRDKGELAVITSVDDANTITISNGVEWAYGTTTLRIRKVNPVADLVIKNGTILGNGIGYGHNGIRVQYGRNVTIENVKVIGTEDTCITLGTVYGGTVKDCDLRNATSSATIGTTGYLVSVVEGSRDVTLDNNQFYNSRHWVTGGGAWPAMHVTVVNCHGTRASASSYDVHESCRHWTFDNCTATGVSGGFGIRGQYIRMTGCTVMDSTANAFEAKTFDLVSEQRGIRFENCTAINCVAAFVLDGAAHSPDPECPKIDCAVIGGTAIDCGTATADAYLIRNFVGMKIEGNTIIRAGRNGMLILGLASGNSSGLSMANNDILSAGNHAVEIQLVDDWKSVGGTFTSPVKFGYNILNCNRGSIASLTVRNPGQNGVFVSGGDIHTFTGAQISGGSNASYDAIRASGTGHVTVTGGYLASARYALNTSTTDNVLLTGVDVTGAANSARISVDATTQIISNNVGLAAAAGSSDSDVAAAITSGSATQAAGDSRWVKQGVLCINVKDYGATGNGVTDDSVAVAAAQTAAATGSTRGLFFPNGTYLYSGTITAKTVFGENRQKTILKYTGTTAAFGPEATAMFDRRLANFTVLGPGSGTTGRIGLDMDRHASAHVENVLVQNFDIGVWLRDTGTLQIPLYNTFVNVRTSSTAAAAFRLESSGGNENRFIGCRIATSTVGLDIIAGSHNIWEGPIEGCTTGLQIGDPVPGTNQTRANTISHSRFENNTTNYNIASGVQMTALVANREIGGTSVNNGSLGLHVDLNTGAFAGVQARLTQPDAAASTVPLLVTNAGTGNSITAPSFEVTNIGNVKCAQAYNLTSFNNARIQFPTTGIVIDRNVADASTTLKVNNISASNTGNIVEFQTASAIKARVMVGGQIATRANAAPADASLAAGEAALWFDSTNGAAKLMVKAKQADGSVIAGTPFLLPDSVARDVFQNVGGTWPARPADAGSARVNYITQPGNTTGPTDYVAGLDTIMYRSA